MSRVISHLFAVLSLGLALLWPSAAAAQFETPNRQFHEKTAFRLEGRHLAVACDSCHLKGVFKGTPTKCVDCHWVRRQDDRFRLQLGSQCEQCHTPVSWASARFDHGAITGLALAGEHRKLPCQSCHKNDNFRSAQTACISCHLKDYQSAAEPNHVSAGFPTTCETCHRFSDASFKGASFNHASVFALVGVHAQQPCATCHVNNVYRGTARDCVGCHRVDYNRTTSPPHAAAGFSTTCESCHRATDSSFKGVSFNHASFFPLLGVHAQQPCATCHVNNVYRGTARDCVGCHRVDYNKTTSPPHASAGFSTACESCHRATDPSFKGATFNHASFFALVGVHAQQACASCHVNNVYRGTARDCVGCHRAKYDRTTSPSHTAAGFPTSCESCHRATDASWNQGTFNHRFPIASGRHKAPCATCHTNSSTYSTFSCLTCHEHNQADMDKEHRNRTGYRYDSLACYSCHPTGRS